MNGATSGGPRLPDTAAPRGWRDSTGPSGCSSATVSKVPKLAGTSHPPASSRLRTRSHRPATATRGRAPQRAPAEGDATRPGHRCPRPTSRHLYVQPRTGIRARFLERAGGSVASRSPGPARTLGFVSHRHRPGRHVSTSWQPTSSRRGVAHRPARRQSLGEITADRTADPDATLLNTARASLQAHRLSTVVLEGQDAASLSAMLHSIRERIER